MNKSDSGQFLSSHFQFLERIVNLNLTFAVCLKRDSKYLYCKNKFRHGRLR